MDQREVNPLSMKDDGGFCGLSGSGSGVMEVYIASRALDIANQSWTSISSVLIRRRSVPSGKSEEAGNRTRKRGGLCFRCFRLTGDNIECR